MTKMSFQSGVITPERITSAQKFISILVSRFKDREMSWEQDGYQFDNPHYQWVDRLFLEPAMYHHWGSGESIYIALEQNPSYRKECYKALEKAERLFLVALIKARPWAMRLVKDAIRDHLGASNFPSQRSLRWTA